MVDAALSVHKFSSSEIEPEKEITKVESTKVVIQTQDVGTAKSMLSLKDQSPQVSEHAFSSVKIPEEKPEVKEAATDPILPELKMADT